MAARPRRRTPAKAATAAASSNPQDWLFLNPGGVSESGIVFGCLRKTYKGRTNSAVEFGWHKAHPLAPPHGVDTSRWAPTAERVEVVLPTGADDGLLDPVVLLARMDACAVAREKALLVYLTLPLGHAGQVHEARECARSFVRNRFARERGLATMLALHSPGRVGSPNPLHAHALIVPRRLSLGIEHGAYDEELIRDAGQAIVEADWTEHLAAFL